LRFLGDHKELNKLIPRNLLVLVFLELMKQEDYFSHSQALFLVTALLVVLLPSKQRDQTLFVNGNQGFREHFHKYFVLLEASWANFD